MKHLRKLIPLLLTLALLAGQFAFSPTTQAKADPVYTCLPTCEVNDARFLTIAGTGLQTLADESINLQIAVDALATSFEIGIFDGDGGGTWDGGTAGVRYSLYADPLAVGSQDTLVGEWLSTAMPNNAWFNQIIPTSLAAKAPSGNYFYLLIARPAATSFRSHNNFKVRTDGLLLTFRPSPFAFMATSFSDMSSLYIVYPAYPSLTPTTYDGQFNLFFYVSRPTTEFITWDGDLDFGSFDRVDLDTDDLDTPNIVPVWAGPYARAEGIALGTGGSTGSPNDDIDPISVLRRSPSVFYTVTDPSGKTFLNANPSGNLEWEQFVISSDPMIPADHYMNDILLSGIYRVNLMGMDLGNLNAWRSLYPVMGVCPAIPGQTGVPCKDILYPYIIGDTLFYDFNGDGMQNPSEPGIPGVIVNLLDGYGNPVLDINGNPITAVTDANGQYKFQVEGQRISPFGEVLNDGVYTVQVDPANFLPGGSLYGTTSTTGGEEQTNTVTTSNVMTYDFGYGTPSGAIGDLVWQDSNGNGIFEPVLGELGLPGVQVNLSIDFNNDGIIDYTATTTTDASGLYSFTNLLPGTYTVSVNTATLPAGMAQTYDYDGLLTPNSALIPLAASAYNQDADYGYQLLTSPGTGTIGFWKTHPEAWPVTSITIGGRTYTREQALALMNKSGAGDKTYDLFAQLVAAKLNVGIGNLSTCISPQILAADTWMAQYPVGSKIKANSAAWKAIESTFTLLDAYNNGLLCAPHRG